MAPKMSPGAPRERPKTRPKNKRKIIEKKVMQVTQGHAEAAGKLGRAGGFPLNPAGAPPTGARQTLGTLHLVHKARWRIRHSKCKN